MKKTNLITYSLLMCLVLSIFALANYFIKSVYPIEKPKLSCKQKCNYVCNLASKMIERPKGYVSPEVEQKLQELKENAKKCSQKCIYDKC